MARKPRQRRWHEFRQSTPVVVGRRTVAQPLHVQPGWLLLGIVVAVALGAVVWFSYSPRFYVVDAQVTGAQRVPEQLVFEASGLRFLHILWASEGAAEDSLLRVLPSLAAAEVTCTLPAHCTIAVTERPPLITWQDGGQLYWVDAEGWFSPAEQPLAEGWTVSGPLPVAAEGRIEQGVLAALAELEQLGLETRTLGYASERGLFFEDSAGWRVVLGEGTGMAHRMAVYAVVREHLLQGGILPCFVDLRFPEAPYYSEEGEW